MGNLGALFEGGRGGPQDLGAAREWYLKGSALSGGLAMHNLGAMLENGRGGSEEPVGSQILVRVRRDARLSARAQ
jgi:TPR repeat protein